jgi:hypothetical protein
LTADNSVFPYSNANDMRVTQDLNSFGEIIAHAHCSVAGLTLEGEEVALWLLTSLCTSAKREVEVAL